MSVAVDDKRLVDKIRYPRQCDQIARRAHSQLIVISFVGLALAISWAALTSLDKVTRGSGRIMPQSTNKMVQHFEGGIITEILVSEGEKVAAGASLMRIDNSFSRSELSQNRLDLRSRLLQISRLKAETTGASQFIVDPEIETDLPDLVSKERSLFQARSDGLNAQLYVIDDQLKQKLLEYTELTTKRSNLQAERELFAPRVEGIRRLVRIGAASQNELLDNERSLQQIASKLSEMEHEIPRTEAAASELRRRREEAILHFRADAEKERRGLSVEAAKFQEAIAAMQDRNKRSEVLAPIAGTVNKLFVNTVGGTVKSGEPLVQLVPIDESIIVEARLSPQDRAEVWPGLPAVVKVSAYDFSIYGGLKGKVIDISPDALTDDNGDPYFRVRLEANAIMLGKGKPVVPGMQAQVDILTGQQTVLDYIVKPIRSLRDNAFRQ